MLPRGSLSMDTQMVKVGQIWSNSQLWANSGKSWSNSQTRGVEFEIGQKLSY